MIKNITIFIATSLVVLSFSACSDEAGFNEAKNIVDICECSSDGVFRAEAFTPMQSGDKIEKEKAPTRIKTYLDSDGVKKVCVSSGSAYLVRQ